MRLGLALPQYDYSIAGESPLQWSSVVAYARAAESAGYDSLWVSDHLFLDVAKYGGPPDRYGVFDPIVLLAALASQVPRVAVGDARVVRGAAAGVGAGEVAGQPRPRLRRSPRRGRRRGWYEPEYDAIGMAMPSPGERLARLRDAVAVVRGLLGGGPCTYDGRFHRAYDAHNQPPALQRPTPPIIVGGKGDRLLRLVAELADGWNTCWVWTPDAYRERLEVLARGVRRGGSRPGVGAAVARPLRVVRRGRARPRAAVRASAGGHAARRARRRVPRAVARGTPGRHRRPGAGAGGRLGGPRGRDPDRRVRSGAVRGHRGRRRGNAGRGAPGDSHGLRRRYPVGVPSKGPSP